MKKYRFLLIILIIVATWYPLQTQTMYLDSISSMEMHPDQVFLVHQNPPKAFDLLTFLERFGDIEVEGDLKTQFNRRGEADSLFFDLYQPAKASDHLRPLLIFAHGGAFVTGSRKDEAVTHLCQELAERGHVCASIDYRLMSFPYLSFVQAGYLALQDTRAAIRYFRHHANLFEIDPDRIYIGGISAGGITAVHAGFYDADEDMLKRSVELEEAFGCLDCVGDFQNVSSAPAGVISIVGGSPMLDIFDNPVPSLHIYCQEDQIVPADHGSPLLLEQLQEIGGDFINTLIKILDIPVIYGPESIKKYADPSITRYLPFEDCNHSLLVFSEGDPKPFSPIILDSISAFLWDDLVPRQTDLNLPSIPVLKKTYSITLPEDTKTYDIRIDNGRILKKNDTSFSYQWKKAGQGRLELKRMNRVGIWSDPIVYEAAVKTNPDYTAADDADLKKYGLLVALVILTLIIIYFQRKKWFS